MQHPAPKHIPVGETKAQTSLQSAWQVSIGAQGQALGGENGQPEGEKGQTSQRSCCPSRGWEGREGGVWRELESHVCSLESCGQWEKPWIGRAGPGSWLPALGSIF